VCKVGSGRMCFLPIKCVFFSPIKLLSLSLVCEIFFRKTQRCATEGIGVNTYTILRLEKTSMGILNTSTTKSDCLHTTNFKDPY
jgi:hypothetical protein